MRKTMKCSGHLVMLVGILALCGCAAQSVDTDKQLRGRAAAVRAEEEPIPPGQCVHMDDGYASWYGNELLGNYTANGEKFKPDGITAAHRTLPFGTIVKVIPDGFKGNPDGVVVRINDRGPFIKGRIIDLSAGAARKLGMKDTRKVKIFRCS